MKATIGGHWDPWNEAALASVEDAKIHELARLLELRGQGDDQASVRAAYLELLEFTPGEHVLDIGCGTGVVTRAVAHRVRPNGQVVGLDPSPLMLSIARELAEGEALLAPVEFCVGSVQSLPFAEATFDVVLAITALSHATDGEQALPELIRVARPGGRIGVLDLDTDSWIISHPDRALTRRIAAGASDAVTDGWLARRLPGLFAGLGLVDVRVKAFTPLERDPSGFYAKIAEVRAEQAMKQGAISEEERQAWLAALYAEQAANRFLGGITHLFIWARRPR
jgi:ubiquinone/menaquinone biosynthesis C-methylase UbiE